MRNRDRLLEQLYYTERCIAAGAETLQKQRHNVERLEAVGLEDSAAAVTARTLLTALEQVQQAYIADRDRIRGLLGDDPEALAAGESSAIEPAADPNRESDTMPQG